MSEPIKRIKDSKLFEIVINNLASNHDSHHSIGFSGYVEWELIVVSCVIDAIEYLDITLCTPNQYYYLLPAKCWQCLLCVVNQDPSKNVQRLETRCETFDLEDIAFKQFMRLNTILAENSGFLIDGKLRIRIEIRVTSVVDYNGDVLLNTCDPFENCITIESMDEHEMFYANKQVMLHHCGALRSEIMAGKTEFFVEDILGDVVHEVLQCIHGSPCFRTRFLPKFRADHLKLEDLWQITRFKYTLKIYERDDNPEYDTFGNDLMKHRLKMIDNVKTLQEKVRIWEMEEELNEETIKKIAQKFFSLAVDYRQSE